MNPNIPAARTVAEKLSARMDASPAAQRDAEQSADFTMALAAADACWSANLGDPPSNPDYIRDVAAEVWRLWVRPALAQQEQALAEAQQRHEDDLGLLFPRMERLSDEVDRLHAEREQLLGVPPAATVEVLAAIGAERLRQRAKHGSHAPDSPWMTNQQRLVVLVEEVGEAACALTHDGDPAELKAELEQIGAVVMGWLDALATPVDIPAGHTAAIARRDDGTWGVFCESCSTTAHDYVRCSRLDERGLPDRLVPAGDGEVQR